MAKDSQEESLTTEEKQALRKAKKASKKLSKGQKLEEPTPSEDKKENGAPEEKSKAQLKKERRLVQESQRTAKAGAKQQTEKPITAPEPTKPVVKPKDKNKEIMFLDHLITSNVADIDPETVHPAVKSTACSLKLVNIDGCNGRVLGMFKACLDIIEDYETPDFCDLARDLSSKINHNMDYMRSCRPFIEPMDNALKYLKKKVNSIQSNVKEADAKKDLIDSIKSYIAQNITLASKNIVTHLLKMVGNEEVIATFGYSTLFLTFVERAIAAGREFTVIVFDAKVNGPGSLMVRMLESMGVRTVYRRVTDVSHVLKPITFGIVEAEAVALNGSIIGLCGLAMLLNGLSQRTIPVLVMSQTYKFCSGERTNSFTVNELGTTDHLVNKDRNSSLLNYKESPCLSVVSLVYDVSPSCFVSKLITERGVYHPSMVPVILERNFGDILL